MENSKRELIDEETAQVTGGVKPGAGQPGGANGIKNGVDNTANGIKNGVDNAANNIKNGVDKTDSLKKYG